MGIFAGLASGLVSGAVSAFGSIRANKAAEAAADKQMNFQRESAQSSYQWAVEDMRKAGLNPMLAYQQGGSSALSGATYQPQNVGAGAAGAATSALGAAKLKAELDNIKQDTQKKKTEGQLNDNLGANAVQNWNILREQLHSARSAAAAARHDEAFYNTRPGRIARWMDIIGKSINPFVSASRSVRINR